MTNFNSKNMTEKFNYNQRMDIKYDHQELIDVNQVVTECTDKWFNQTLTKVNGSVVRIGIVEGEYHWHKHDDDPPWSLYGRCRLKGFLCLCQRAAHCGRA